MRPVRTLFAAALAVVALASAAQAQEARRWVRFEVNPYGGIFMFDDSELRDDAGFEVDVGPLLGGRVGVAIGDDWIVEAAYGWASASAEESEFVDFPGVDPVVFDLGIHLAYGSVGYRIGSDVARTQLVLSAGAGLLAIDPEEGDGDADPTVVLGVGFDHPVNDWITFRADARDHIAFCSGAEDFDVGEFAPCLEDEALHHLEVSGGLQFWLW